MSLRTADDIADIVSSLRMELDELKARQFTSQDSGMKFYDCSPPPITFKIPSSSDWRNFRVVHTFTGARGKNVLVIRSIKLTVNGCNLYLDERTQGERYYYGPTEANTRGEWQPNVSKLLSDATKDIQLSMLYPDPYTSDTFTITTQTWASDRGQDIITWGQV